MTDKQYNIAIERLHMPSRIAKLPVSDNGFPVPKFVQWINAKPDFRVINHSFMANAIRLKLCWLCGEALGRYQALTLGPMCVCTRVTSEPPSHLECARFAVKACPFLTQPNRARNKHDLPDNAQDPAGIFLERNPGVTAIYVTESYKLFKAQGANGGGGFLIQIGEPTSVEWWARGREATREEVLHSIKTGIPALERVAQMEGAGAMIELNRRIDRGLALVPA